MSVIAMVETPWALDVPPPSGCPDIVDDNAAMTRGVIMGLGISVPMWLALAWLMTRLASALTSS